MFVPVQVSQWCMEHRSSESIVGLYFANERCDDDSVKQHVTKMAAGIHAKTGAVAVLQIINKTMGTSACVLKVLVVFFNPRQPWRYKQHVHVCNMYQRFGSLMHIQLDLFGGC